MKPDFIIVGASRSGTTSLYQVLKQVPGIFMPEKKELQFFEKDSEYNKGLEYYSNYFKAAAENAIKGEASPPYFHKGIIRLSDGAHGFTEFDAAKRIKKHFPNVKIVMTLRNPVDRLYSQYYKNYFEKQEKKGLEVAIEEELNGKRTPQNTPLCWIYKNTYSEHVSHWINLFGQEKIKILIFENWVKDVAVLDDLLVFLGLPKNSLNVTEIPKRNTGKSISQKSSLSKGWFTSFFKKNPSPTMNEHERKIVRAALENDIQSVEKILNIDLSVWR
jgi:hypothetical protein